MQDNLKPYPQYKESKVSWLGSIPIHWKVIRAKWLFNKMDRLTREEDDVITCFRDGIVTLRKLRRITGFTESLKEIGYQGIRKGDLVIHQMDAFAGAVGVSDSDGKGTPVYSVCVPSDKTSSTYYYASIVREMARSEYILSLSRGIRERSSDFRYATFKCQDLPFPSPEEQHQIARFLDWKSKQITKFINAKKRLIELLKGQKQVIINDAVTGKINVRTGKPYPKYKDSGVEWLGMVPQEWKQRYFFQSFREKNQKNIGNKVNNRLSLSYGKIIRKSIEATEGLLPMTFETYQIVNEGDIILRLTDLQNDHKSLRVGYVTERGIITSAYLCLSTLKDISPEFASIVLHSYDLRKVFYGMGGGVRQSIGFAELKRLPFIIPKEEEQIAILNWIKFNEELINRSILRFENEINLLQEYRTRLIADVVTGKVDVRNVSVPVNETDTVDEVADENDIEEIENPDVNE